MKKYHIIMVAFLLISCKSSHVLSGDIHTKPEKESDFIIIETKESPKQSFIFMISILRNNGFGFLVREAYPPRLKTNFKEFESMALMFETSFTRTDNSTLIKLKGWAKELDSNQRYSSKQSNRIQFYDDPKNLSWKVMNNIALSYSNSTIWYGIE